MSLRSTILRSRVISCLKTNPLHAPNRAESRHLISYTQERPESNVIAAKERTAVDTQIQDSTSIPLPKNWLTDVRKRIGKCITWGLTPAQLEDVGSIMKVVAEDWRDLIAGSQGFLTGKGRDGIKRREVVWGDMDSMGHVNNVAYNFYAESARINWASNYATYIDPKNSALWSKLWTSKGIGLILKRIETNFKFPMTWPDRISVYHRLGSNSVKCHEDGIFSLNVLILSEKYQRASAECYEEIVVYDYNKGEKTHMRPFMAKAFSKTWVEQEQVKKQSIAKIAKLLRQVTELEKKTWDKADAIEDFGSAA